MGDDYCFCAMLGSLRSRAKLSLQNCLFREHSGWTLVGGEEAGLGFQGREKVTCPHPGRRLGRPLRVALSWGDRQGLDAMTWTWAALRRECNPTRWGAIQWRPIPKGQQQRSA